MPANGKFVIIVPAYNRAKDLPQALDSVLAQTDPNWTCFVLDDGSTDGTRQIALDYQRRDNRFRAAWPFDGNRGGVAMNNFGMQCAVEEGEYWVRLGSDDWFLPPKLELDRVAMRYADACFGPYQNEPASCDGEGSFPHNARPYLIIGGFDASWANICVRTSVLEKVYVRHGNFCDPRLRNMEDWSVNVRIARFTDIPWRGLSADGTTIAVGPTDKAQFPNYQPDARYRIASDGATYSPALQDVVRQDMALSERLGGEDRMVYTADEIPETPFVTLPRGG